MTDVVLFHHVQGRTDGVLAFADRLAQGGHTVHTPDLFDGRTFATLEEGLAYVRQLDDGELDARADRTLDDLPTALVYAGISFGVTAAQRFAQTRPDTHGALLYEACLPVTGEWAIGPWPATVPVQIHGLDDDPFFAHEGDLDAARELASTVGPQIAEVFTYPGSDHLFLDESLPTYDPAATAQVVERSLALLDRAT